MAKPDTLPTILPQVGSSNLRGLTLWELERRQELNNRNMALLKLWLNELDNPVTYDYWVKFDQLRKRYESGYLSEKTEASASLFGWLLTESTNLPSNLQMQAKRNKLWLSAILNNMCPPNWGDPKW